MARILAVDDSPTILHLVADMLSSGGHEAIYKFLAQRDISEFPWSGRAPDTESKEVMIEAG